MRVQEEYRRHRQADSAPRRSGCPTWAAHYPDEIDRFVDRFFTQRNNWNGPCTQKAECSGVVPQHRAWRRPIMRNRHSEDRDTNLKLAEHLDHRVELTGKVVTDKAGSKASGRAAADASSCQ
jgi:hypothetical protein